MSRTKKVMPMTEQIIAFVLAEVTPKELKSKFSDKTVKFWSLKLVCDEYIKEQKFMGGELVDEIPGKMTYYRDVRIAPKAVGHVFKIKHILVGSEWLPEGFEVVEKDITIKDKESGELKEMTIKCLK